MIAIIRKDIREWFSGGATGRYGQYEFLIYIVLFGLAMPVFFALGTSSGKHSDIALAPFIGASMPVFLAIYTMADAFAGEKERGTLDTLLMTPLRSVDIVCGKWLAGIAYAGLLMIATTVLSSVVSRALGAHTASISILAQVMGGALVVAGLLAAIEIVVAMRAPTVKAAVFGMNIAFVIVVVGISQILARAATSIETMLAPVVALGSVGLITIGVGVLAVIVAAIAALLWFATQQMRAMRFE